MRRGDTYVNGDAQWGTEFVVALRRTLVYAVMREELYGEIAYRVSLANGSSRVVYAAGDTKFLQFVAQCTHKRLEIAVRAQWYDENLGWCDDRREG